jgi:hypothetical protein
LGFVIGVVVTSAANNRPKWISSFDEGELNNFERVPQKLVRSSPHFVMLDDSEHGFQIPIHGVPSAACLEGVPCVTDLL